MAPNLDISFFYYRYSQSLSLKPQPQYHHRMYLKIQILGLWRAMLLQPLTNSRRVHERERARHCLDLTDHVRVWPCVWRRRRRLHATDKAEREREHTHNTTRTQTQSLTQRLLLPLHRRGEKIYKHKRREARRHKRTTDERQRRRRNARCNITWITTLSLAVHTTSWWIGC